ncbi:MAG: hypothetical protein K5896_01375 [Prevotella sp.]|nr:hypothetical protein [Prevotella sp.]
MKKQYISPLIQIQCTQDDELLNSASITDITGVINPIDTGGSAQEGSGSDSRRHRNLWDDEEEEFY